jgi:hypothetical protein
MSSTAYELPEGVYSRASQTTKPSTTLEPAISSESSLPAGGRSLVLETRGTFKPYIEIFENESRKYFLATRRIKKPDIRLSHKQVDGPLAAVCYIHSWSRVYRIGIGADPLSMEWVDCGFKTWKKEPTFEWKGDTYTLTRVTKAEDGSKLETSGGRWHFGVTDSKRRRVALYSPCIDDKRKAVLEVVESVSEELECMFILSICSWREEIKRAG